MGEAGPVHGLIIMVKVKICGITNREDALHAAACGADALGFVFYAGSPRCVTPEQVAAIVAVLPPFVTRVGLFVNEAPERIRAIAEECGLDVLQLHGDEAPGRLPAAALPGDQGGAPAPAPPTCRPLSGYPVAALLVDAAVPGQFGGTGQRADWELAAAAGRAAPDDSRRWPDPGQCRRGGSHRSGPTASMSPAASRVGSGEERPGESSPVHPHGQGGQLPMTQQPDAKGHFGQFGGRYVAETLMPALCELEQAYRAAQADPLSTASSTATCASTSAGRARSIWRNA